ncbi:PREDICTED: tetraspanin-8 [Nelumbo nucifera]|uniref:Tetraspanin-8 n=2 Tax=Nelumbo nucifera TaxID=4432 RepID=A0A1U8ADL3_NELNU|nr:PREDICTED: tetraspanin-8 [Nelumbo nucifera]DAD35189.1 TPA_asm: hypothetical protein HUJ06_005829 [Nelumbo nucifera]
MARLSNNLIGFLNILTAVLSIFIIVIGFFFKFKGFSECQKLLQLPLLIFGAFLLFVSLLGLIGSCCRVSYLLCFYLFVMFLLIVATFVFTIFAFVVTNKGVGKVISGTGYKEYKLGDYSNWLQKHVVDGDKWNKIKSCLIDAQVCRSLGQDANQRTSHFYQKNLSPIQSGCCKPPTYCKFIYKNATFWKVPRSGPAVPDSDCTAWSNQQQTLCYGCKSCKAGFLANLRTGWRKIAIVNISVLVFIMLVYTIGCCAYRNSREDRYRYQGAYH